MRQITRALAVLGAFAFAFLGASAAVAAPATPTGAAASVPFAAPVAAGVDDFTFDSLDVDYTLTRAEDGTSRLRVVETFAARFPETDQNRGMRRAIPERYNGMPLFPDVVSVTDGDGSPRPFETDSDDGFLYVTSAADSYVHGVQTYVFTYTMENVTWTFADTNADEFYWDVNGTGWGQPFGRVTATVNLEDGLADALTGSQACYQGGEGSTDPCDITGDGETIRAEATGLGAYETMTIAIGFEQSTFTLFDTSYFASPWGWAQGVAGLGMAGALVSAFIVRRRRLQDEPGRGTIIPRYTPPDGVDAAIASVLLGKSGKAVPAEVLEQAVVGSIRIFEAGKTWTGKVKLEAELIDPLRADGDGRIILEGLFGGAGPGARFAFGTTNSRLSSAATRVLSWANKEVVRRGWRKKVPAGVRALPILLAVVAGGLSVLFGIIASAAGVNPVVPILLIIAAPLIIMTTVVILARKPLTTAGSEVMEHLHGLEMFIEWAEADRIRMLQSPQGAERVPVDGADPRQVLRLYESLLPFAVVFGQERQWAQIIAVMHTTVGTAPYWYIGVGAFDAGSFATSIGSVSTSAAASSSSSGGSGGGGGAGGGGGGGGGGGV